MRLRKIYVKWALALLGVGSVVSIWYQHRFPSWTEEVLLEDGRKILVKQRRDFIEGYGTRKAWLTVSLPELNGEQTWSEHMQPALIAVSSIGKVYVVGWPTGEKQMAKYRHPLYGYVAFEWKENRFERIPFLSVPEDLRQEENLVRCLPRVNELTWKKKETMTCDDVGKYVLGTPKKIDLEKMKSWAYKQAARNNIKPLSE